MTKENTDTIYLVTTQSGVHLGLCLLGKGDTRAEAIEDAGGRRCIGRNAVIKAWDLDEAIECFSEEDIYC